MKLRIATTRTLLGALLATSLSACAGEGINAGTDGGIAFIVLAVFLIVGCLVLWLAFGRED